MSKSWNVAYYILTVLLSAVMLFGSYFDLTYAPQAVQIFMHLGYPAYLLVILGVARIFGVAALWQSKVPFVREWAYAGFMIEMVGAFASHIAVGDGPAQYTPALVVLVLVIFSYIAFRKTRAVI